MSLGRIFRLRYVFAEMNGRQLLLCPFPSAPQTISAVPDQLSVKKASQPSESKGIMTPCWSQERRGSTVYYSLCQALQGNAWVPSSSESLCFHPSAFKSPTSHCIVGASSLLFGKWLESKPPFLEKIPLSRQLKQLQAAWDFSVHVGSTYWAWCFSLGFRKVRMAVYWISKHTDHTALPAH